MIKALIADDSQIVRKIIRTNLEKCDIFDILEVNNGSLALQLLTTNKDINLLFLDLVMPNKNGIDVLKDFLKKSSIEHLEIIAISSELNPDIIARFSQLGVKNFIPKPFDIEQFKKVVVPLLEKVKQKKIKKIDLDDVKQLFEDKHKSEFDGKNIVVTSDSFEMKIDFKNCLKSGFVELKRKGES